MQRGYDEVQDRRPNELSARCSFCKDEGQILEGGHVRCSRSLEMELRTGCTQMYAFLVPRGYANMSKERAQTVKRTGAKRIVAIC